MNTDHSIIGSCQSSRAELAALAEQLKASGIGLELLTGELRGSHDPSGIILTVLATLSGMEREYIRDCTLEGHESARARAIAQAVRDGLTDGETQQQVEERIRAAETQGLPLTLW